MKISFRIFLGFVLLLASGFLSLIAWMAEDVYIQPKKAMEEALADMALILASYLETQINPESGQINTLSLSAFMNLANARKFRVRIYELEKTGAAIDVYVADEAGKVIFSTRRSLLGLDFSRQRDVYRTLNGRYGARTTRQNPDDPESSVAYVAAPIHFKGKITGVCTVSKSWQSIHSFYVATRRKILLVGLSLLAAAITLSFFIARWITQPIRKLAEYADMVKYGVRAFMPKLTGGEIKALGQSFERMRENLEGRNYIEKYVQTLTHQLKGPLSAIRGAAELLQEDLPDVDRRRFVSNIESESIRLQRIVERMLELAALEQQRELRNVETLDLGEIVHDMVRDMQVRLKQKETVLLLAFKGKFLFRGERFLIYQALYNLLQNAVDFSPQGGDVLVEIERDFNRFFLIIRDSGPGIPDYALDKVFDKFYSLPRPDTGKKSSGLGLSLVKEVAELHQGEIKLKNGKEKGAVAIFKLPANV